MIKNKVIGAFISATLLLASPLMAAAGGFEIKYMPAAFTAEPTLNIIENSEHYKLPWEWEALTPAYEYSFNTAGFYDPSYPLEVKISYPQASNRLKQVFSFDFLSGVWRPIPTKDNPQEKYVTVTTDATSGWLVLLAKPEVMTSGDASWYKYKGGLFAASPDFPKGTVLRVVNTANNKTVDVTINDFGPDRNKHPQRVIDLDKVAFEKISPLSAGIINVRVEVVKPLAATTAPTAAKQETDTPNVTASSSIIIKEGDGSVLWSKNAQDVSPLASLTKLIAASVFLDTKPTLSNVVSYKKQDEEYNYLYCKPWESASLKVKDGEKMTVENLLYAALVGSANNAVESLVRISGLKRADFIAKMNAKAKSWGAVDTKFIEPTGLSPENVSSPHDYAIMVREIFKNPLLQKISTAKKYSFATIDTKQEHTFSNTNQLLKSGLYSILGSKTGYLDEAGYCLMTRVASPSGNLIVVNFGSKSKVDNFADNEQLIRYGLKIAKVQK